MDFKTTQELENYIASHANNGTNMFASVMTVTEPKMVVKDRITKEPNPYLGRVKKISKMVLSLGNNYESAVENRRKKEGVQGGFQAGTITGRRHVSRMILESEKNPEQKYLEVFAMSNTPAQVEYRLDDGTVVDAEKIKPYLPVESENKSQGLENDVKVFTYKLENVREVKIGERTFI
jgi:hypothetical protein